MAMLGMVHELWIVTMTYRGVMAALRHLCGDSRTDLRHPAVLYEAFLGTNTYLRHFPLLLVRLVACLLPATHHNLHISDEAKTSCNF